MAAEACSGRVLFHCPNWIFGQAHRSQLKRSRGQEALEGMLEKLEDGQKCINNQEVVAPAFVHILWSLEYSRISTVLQTWLEKEAVDSTIFILLLRLLQGICFDG